MGEIRFVGTGETRGYPYLVCKKRIVGPGKTRGYPYPLCKNKGYVLFCSVVHSVVVPYNYICCYVLAYVVSSNMLTLKEIIIQSD